MKKFVVFFTICTSLISCAQNKATVITDANGNEIKSNNQDINPNNLEITVEKFYKNINNTSELDQLLSFRFYQKIPYNKFKDITNEKFKKFGNLVNTNKLATEFSPDKKAVKYTFDNVYEKAKTRETLILIKENEKDNFKIFEYNYQEIK